MAAAVAPMADVVTIGGLRTFLQGKAHVLYTSVPAEAWPLIIQDAIDELVIPEKVHGLVSLKQMFTSGETYDSIQQVIETKNIQFFNRTTGETSPLTPGKRFLSLCELGDKIPSQLQAWRNQKSYPLVQQRILLLSQKKELYTLTVTWKPHVFWEKSVFGTQMEYVRYEASIVLVMKANLPDFLRRARLPKGISRPELAILHRLSLIADHALSEMKSAARAAERVATRQRFRLDSIR